MLNTFKAELRKLFTVRTTYILSIIGLALTIFVSFYAEGFRLNPAQLHDPNQLAADITGALTSIPLIFASIVAILFVTHEYRYNTIMYTLTASNSRGKVLVAKALALTVYALPFTVIVAVISPLASYLGAQANHLHLAHQTIPYASLAWRCLLYGWLSIIAAYVIALIVRNQVGAIVTLFVIPTAEQIAAQLLKAKAVYLPFISSNEILEKPSQGSITYGHAALVFTGYVVVASIVAWVLFVKRDAN